MSDNSGTNSSTALVVGSRTVTGDTTVGPTSTIQATRSSHPAVASPSHCAAAPAATQHNVAGSFSDRCTGGAPDDKVIAPELP